MRIALQRIAKKKLGLSLRITELPEEHFECIGLRECSLITRISFNIIALKLITGGLPGVLDTLPFFITLNNPAVKRFKNIISGFWILLLVLITIIQARSLGQVPSQPEKIEIDKLSLVNVLKDFIEDAKKNRAFYEDKGVINLTLCPSDSVCQTRYSLSVLIDNRYEDLPIFKYAYFDNYVVLFDSCRFVPGITDKGEYFKTLNDEIGDRVYKRPTKKGRWMTYRTKEGKTVNGMRELMEIRGGEGQQNNRVYIVDKNNKFRKYKTL